ncbi:MAG: NADPH-dependent FMN reductase [Acidimicrobiales bacterium]
MTIVCRLLLISGSLRDKSTNTAVLRTGQALAPQGIEPAVYDRLANLPHFNPDHDIHPPAATVGDLRAQIRAADAMVFSIPEYTGALPGSLKNLLDWTIGDEQPGSIYEKPDGWINASPRGAINAHDQLRLVPGYAHATIIEAACAHLSVTTAIIGDDGLIANAEIRTEIAKVLTALATHLGSQIA